MKYLITGIIALWAFSIYVTWTIAPSEKTVFIDPPDKDYSLKVGDTGFVEWGSWAGQTGVVVGIDVPSGGYIVDFGGGRLVEVNKLNLTKLFGGDDE